MLFDTQKVLADKNISMKVTIDAKKFLLEKGTDLKYGARPLRRAIQKHIEDEISEMILKGEVLPSQTLNVDCVDDKLVFNVKQ